MSLKEEDRRIIVSLELVRQIIMLTFNSLYNTLSPH
jgi:hypothetical protein